MGNKKIRNCKSLDLSHSEMTLISESLETPELNKIIFPVKISYCDIYYDLKKLVTLFDKMEYRLFQNNSIEFPSYNVKTTKYDMYKVYLHIILADLNGRYDLLINKSLGNASWAISQFELIYQIPEEIQYMLLTIYKGIAINRTMVAPVEGTINYHNTFSQMKKILKRNNLKFIDLIKFN